jgi:hypothetical protein
VEGEIRSLLWPMATTLSVLYFRRMKTPMNPEHQILYLYLQIDIYLKIHKNIDRQGRFLYVRPGHFSFLRQIIGLSYRINMLNR